MGEQMGNVCTRSRGQDSAASIGAAGAECRGNNRLLLLRWALLGLLALVGAAAESGKVKARFKTVEILVTEYQPLWQDEVSDLKQDSLVLSILGGAPGYFIELGAHDGFFFSNTLTLERQFNWTGLCIEPNHRNIFKLAHREGCRVISALVADTDGEMVDFKVFDEGPSAIPSHQDKVWAQPCPGGWFVPSLLGSCS